jgi:hypothetical protein
MKNIALAVTMSVAAIGADAATIDIAVTLTPEQTAAATLDVLAPTSTTGGFFSNATGSVGGVRRSPYDTVAGLASTGKYHSVQGGGSATYVFDDLQTGFSLLWGSPDSYNTLTFFNGADEVIVGPLGTSVTGAEIGARAPISPLGGKFAFVTFGDILFDKVVLTSGSNAFEYGLVESTPAPVPLPAAGWMLIAGLGALAAAGRARRARA